MASVGNQGRSRTAARNAFAIAMALCTANLLMSCNSATVGTTAPADIDVLDKVRSLDILPRQTQPVGAVQSNTGERGRAAVFEGTEITEIPDARVERAATGNGYDLNFENTPVATVAKVVLGDILNTGYAIDPRVQGTVSLVSVRPVPKSDIVFVLENALRLSGVVLVRDSAPEPLIAELEKIMDSGESGFSQSVVKFQPISRLNAILVVSRKPALLHTAATWIRRLDHADTARNSVHVYRVKYGEARQIARVLTDMFIGGSSAPLSTPTHQLTPVS